MITIENSIFKFEKTKDTYKITNKLASTINYTLSRANCNEGSPLIEKEGVITVNGNIIFDTLKDGKYTLNINGSFVYFVHWVNRRNYVISMIKTLLCNRCKDCKTEDCSSKEANNCLRNQSLINNILTLQNMFKDIKITPSITLNGKLGAFFQTVFYNNFCTINKELCKQDLDISITGKPFANQYLFNYYISIYYLGFYFYEKSYLTLGNQEELDYLNKVYDFNNIKSCLKDLGMCIQDLEELYNNIVIDCPDISDITNLNLTLTGQLDAGTVTFSHQFLISEIASMYNSGGVPTNTIIKSLPNKGNLNNIVTPIQINDIILTEESGNIFYSYSALLENVSLVPTSFEVQMLDTLGNLTGIGIITINFKYPAGNQPPGKLGGFGYDMVAGQTITIPETDFQTNGYLDPEGDPLLAMKIVNLGYPEHFEITINNTPVVVGQEYYMSELLNPSNLGIKVKALNPPIGIYTLFTYIGKDSGSNTYTEYLGSASVSIN